MGAVEEFGIQRSPNLTELPSGYFSGWIALKELNIDTLDSWRSLPDFKDISSTLIELYASENVFDTVSLANIAILRSLTVLYLQETSIPWLPSTCPFQPEIYEINIMDSPTLDPCSCELQWLKMIQQEGGKVRVSSDLTCNGLSWSDTIPEELHDECKAATQSAGE